MAVEFKVEHTRTSEYLILPKDIKFKPELNGRHELPDIEWLVTSMVKNGQLQPVLVRNDGGMPILVAGFSRWRAAVEINKRKLTPKPFRLRCVNFSGSEQQAFLANIEENHKRKDTTEIDDAFNCARLERYGMSHQEIAEVYHENVAWVKKRIALVSLTVESQKAVKEGRVKPNAAATLAKLSEEEQARAVKEATVEHPVTNGALKPPPKPGLRAVVKMIAEGGSPFDVDNAARVFCVRLLDFMETK